MDVRVGQEVRLGQPTGDAPAADHRRTPSLLACNSAVLAIWALVMLSWFALAQPPSALALGARTTQATQVASTARIALASETSETRGFTSSKTHATGWSKPLPINSNGPSRDLAAVACPTTTQCTEVDSADGEVTFDPQRKHLRNLKRIVIDPIAGGNLNSIACSSTTSCVAVDLFGNAVSFNPRSPRHRRLVAADPGQALYAVACVRGGRCTAIDGLGREVTN